MKRNLKMLALALLAFTGGAFTVHYLEDPLTSADIRAAAKIMGLEFSAAEIDSLLPGVEEFRQTYAGARRDFPGNEVAPALVFSPLLPGMKLPQGPSEVVLSPLEKIKLPADRAELAFYSVHQLAALLRTRQISSVELTQFFLDRLKKYDPTLHCVVTLTEQLALQQAARADAEIKAGRFRSLLHGIPCGVKDLLATKGYPTTWGSVPYRNQMLDLDATVVQKLEQAGAVLLAKLTLGELAWGDVWFGGMTRNPWNPTTGSSGSSAGSAAAVSAGLVPFAIGTETLGSIVSPATVCGVTGLRPTFGRVSRHGAMALSWSMDKIGPICRTVEDCAIVFNAIYGPDGRDLAVINAPFQFNSLDDPRKLKVGYIKSDFDRSYPFHKNDSMALAKLRALGWQLQPITLPELPDLSIILAAEAAAAFDELTISNRDDEMVRQIKNAWPNTFREARFIPAVEYIQANRRRTQLMAAMAKVFEQVDVYVHPSWGSSSLRITNHTGHPCVVVPNGFRQGTPTSISFTGKLFEEGKLLLAAKAFQEATDHHRQHPVLKAP